MDKIWYRNLRNRRSLAVVAGVKKTNDHAEPTKVAKKKITVDMRLLLCLFANCTD